jgi:hypothetical protein
MKRVILFLFTNLAVMVVLSIVTNLLGLNQALAANGLEALFATHPPIEERVRALQSRD